MPGVIVVMSHQVKSICAVSACEVLCIVMSVGEVRVTVLCCGTALLSVDIYI